MHDRRRDLEEQREEIAGGARLEAAADPLRRVCAAAVYRITLCIYLVHYEWDEGKSRRNEQKHGGISFEWRWSSKTNVALFTGIASTFRLVNNGGSPLGWLSLLQMPGSC